jgi:hypothetical protein
VASTGFEIAHDQHIGTVGDQHIKLFGCRGRSTDGFFKCQRAVQHRADHLCALGHLARPGDRLYRPGSELSVALLPGRDGTLKALSIKAFADAGVGVNSTIAALARLIYAAEAKELVDYDVVSNVALGAPFRRPGGPVLCFALEQAVDEAAARLRIDPIALRQQWDPDVNRQRLYAWA